MPFDLKRSFTEPFKTPTFITCCSCTVCLRGHGYGHVCCHLLYDLLRGKGRPDRLCPRGAAGGAACGYSALLPVEQTHEQEGRLHQRGGLLDLLHGAQLRGRPRFPNMFDLSVWGPGGRRHRRGRYHDLLDLPRYPGRGRALLGHPPGRALFRDVHVHAQAQLCLGIFIVSTIIEWAGYRPPVDGIQQPRPTVYPRAAGSSLRPCRWCCWRSPDKRALSIG